MKFIGYLLCSYLTIAFLLQADPQKSSSVDEHAFYSQAEQDKFVYTILYDLLGKKNGGYYLEIGASDPIYTNNSYFFEKHFNWSGISVELLDEFQDKWQKTRKNPLIISDATQVDYSTLLEGFPKTIDYLSLDIDNHYDIVLNKIPFQKHIFKIITIEHDFYKYHNRFRKEERRILSSLGYYLLCPNVSHKGDIFEDWWIHPSAFPPHVFAKLKRLNLKSKDHRFIMRTLQRKMCDIR